MARKYTRIAESKDALLKLREEGKTLREAAQELGFTYEEAHNLISRHNRMERRLAAGYIARPKGRPCKNAENDEISQKNKITSLEMTVELLRNFLSEAGRR